MEFNNVLNVKVTCLEMEGFKSTIYYNPLQKVYYGSIEEGVQGTVDDMISFKSETFDGVIKEFVDAILEFRFS